MYSVSQSKLKLWQRCRYAYHLRYVERLRPKRKARPLEFGTIAHTMIEHHLEGADPFKALAEIERERGHMFRAEIEEYGDILADAEVIMDEYFDHWKGDKLKFDRLNGRRAELEFSVPIADGIELTGKIDGVATSENKLRWLVEHKTFNRLPSEDERWRSIQSSVYIKVIDMLKLKPVDGTLWDYVWSKAPTRPQLLKNGKLARRAIVTLPTAVLNTIRDHKLKARDYQDVIDKAYRGRSAYFQRIFTPTRATVVDNIFQDFVEVAKEMRDLHGRARARNIDRHCSFCDFEPICRAEIMGHDASFVRSKQYEKSSGQNQKAGNGHASRPVVGQ